VAWPAVTLLVSTLAIVTVAMVALWLGSLAVRDASIADLFWGPGFAIVGWSSAALTGNWAGRPLLVNVLVTLWAVRLAVHLALRHHGEDRRYAVMRRRYGAWFPLVSLGVVFLFQGLLLWIVSWPIQATHMGASRALGVGDLAALGVWLVGMLLESVADAQLARFRRDPRNVDRVMNRGLWRYSRHPNYFGDCVAWWGIGMFALGQGAWWSLAGPALMTVLLVKVSGVDLLESTIVARRPGYRDYIKTTSAFVPWPPRATARS
jgi:steroid 5-alpha reductase family enzyme